MLTRSRDEHAARDPDEARLGAARALFLRLAGVVPGDGGREALRGAVALARWDPGWADLRVLARREGVSSALWPRVRRLIEQPDVEQPPAAVVEAFRREGMIGEFHARRMEARLHEVLAILGSRGIEPVLLKGAGLAYSVYGGMAHRPMRDLDLLVPGERIEAAVAALQSAGWTSERPSRSAVAYSGHHHAPPLVEPGGGPAVVELHGALLPVGHPFHLHGHQVMARARRVATPVGALLVPRAVDQLIHACVHFAWSHELRWGAWRTFADVAAIVEWAAAEDARPVSRGEEPVGRALDELVSEALAARAGTSVYWTLLMAADLSGAAVPEAWLSGLGPSRAPSSLVRHLAHQLLPGPGVVPSVRLARAGWAAAIRPGRSGHGRSRPWLLGVGAASPVDVAVGGGEEVDGAPRVPGSRDGARGSWPVGRQWRSWWTGLGAGVAGWLGRWWGYAAILWGRR